MTQPFALSGKNVQSFLLFLESFKIKPMRRKSRPESSLIMSIYFRAASAAAALFVLGACTTTAISPVSPETVSKTAAAVDTATQSADIIAASPAADTIEVADTSAASTPAPTPAPAANETLLYGAQTKYELMTFVEAVNGASLQSALEGERTMTVFAPNNQAFEYAGLSASEDISALLQSHMIEGALDLAALKTRAGETGRATLTTAAGTELTLYVRDDVVKVAGPNGVLATVTQGDMIQSNGVMHQISSVLEAE